MRSYISKTAPVELNDKRECVIWPPPFENAAPAAGDRVFLWFSETQTGSGLTHRGGVLALGDESPPSIAVLVDRSCSPGALTNAALQKMGGGPANGLITKLYLHAHNKIAELSPEEADFLDAFFQDAPEATPSSR